MYVSRIRELNTRYIGLFHAHDVPVSKVGCAMERYVVGQEIGRGSYGVVYKVFHSLCVVIFAAQTK